MAFESFLNQDQAKPKRWQRLTIAVSLALHGVLLVVALVYSFWHVEELSPPSVTVTFMSAPPPPPPPPPPPKKKSSTPKTKPKTTTEVVQPKPTDIVQPKERKEKEEPKEEPEDNDDGEEGGVEGGQKGGVVGGVVGGTLNSNAPPAPTNEPPKTLPPSVAEQQKLSTPDPVPPAVLQRAGTVVFTMAKICVNAEGSVSEVKIVKPGEPLWDKAVTDTVRGWKFKPTVINGHPVPFCYISRFNLKIVQ